MPDPNTRGGRRDPIDPFHDEPPMPRELDPQDPVVGDSTTDEMASRVQRVVIEPDDLCTLSMRQIAQIFTEWDRRYREDPEAFMSEAARLLKETPETYGDACAPYFLKIADDLYRRVDSTFDPGPEGGLDEGS